MPLPRTSTPRPLYGNTRRVHVNRRTRVPSVSMIPLAENNNNENDNAVNLDENQPNGPIPIDTSGNINIPKAQEFNFLQEIYLSLRRQENRTEAFIKQVKKMNQKYWQKQHEQLCEFLRDEHERNIKCWKDQKKSFDDGIQCVKDEVIQRFKRQDEYSGAILQCLQQVKSSVGELIQEKTERLKSENEILHHQKESNQFENQSNKKTCQSIETFV